MLSGLATIIVVHLSATLTPVHTDSIQDALRAFMPPLGSDDDPRLDFYMMYKREAMDYDTNFVKKYDEDLNTTLIFAGLFSAVSSAFVIDVQPKLQPDPGDQSVEYLRAILLALNQPTAPGEQVVPPSTWTGPAQEIVHVSNLLYASLLISLFAAFIAMLGKQWLNRYLRHVGGSMTERCGDRQRKLDGLEKWPFRWLIEGLPIMLQIALLLLSCGLSRYMWSINTSVARVVIAFTVLTVVFYLVIMVAGMRSYDSPFQTPASLGLRALRHNEGVQKFLTVVSPPVVIIHTAGTNTINHIVEASRQLGRSLDRGFQNAKAKIVQGVLDLRRALLPTHADPPRRQPPPGARPRPARISVETPLEKNSNDAHCVCWVLWNITDPEAIDSAMRLAATIRWFDDGVDTDPPYDLIVSVFNSCFDSSSNLYPGMRDRAYCSGRTVLAIYVSTLVNHPERAPEFPPRNCHIPTQSFPQDPDLKSILRVFCNFSNNSPPFQDFIHPRNTSAHILWMTDLYLRYIWSQRNNLNPHHHGLLTPLKVEYEDWHTFPTTAVANLLLTRCLFLGAQVEDGILRNVDKSDDLKEISSRLSRAVINAAGHSHPHHWLLSDLLDGLAKWTSPPAYFTRYAYEWCAAICKENEDLDACKDLLVSALRLGFRRDDIYLGSPPYHPVHPDHHKRMIDVVFSTGNTDTIADALCAWTIDDTPQHRFSSLGACADHLVNLAGTKFPKRLRRMVIRAIEGIGYPEFERVGIEKFVPLLNGLNIEVCEMGQDLSLWTSHLWNVLRSSLGQEQLSSHYWQHIVPMAMQPGLNPLHVKSSDLDTMRSFEKKGDWKRLEVWIGMMWVLELPGGGIEVREVERATRTLFRERPGAFQTVEGWVLEASESDSLYTQHGNIFRMVCDEARKEEERKRSSQMPQSGGAEADNIFLLFACDDPY